MDAADRFLQRALEVTGAQTALLLALDAGERPRLVRGRLDDGTVPSGTPLYSRVAVQRVVDGGRGVSLIDVLRPDVTPAPSILDLECVTVACVPLRRAGAVAGLLYVHADASCIELGGRARAVACLEELAGSASPDVHRFLRPDEER